MTESYGSFGTESPAFDLAFGSQKWGNFIAANGLTTDRFLDPPEFVVMHDYGNEENIFDRADYKLSDSDSLQLNMQYTRSRFQNPNSYDQLNVGGVDPVTGNPVGTVDQSSYIRTFDIAPSWSRVIGTAAVFTLGAFVRQDRYTYYSSGNPFADFTPSVQSETIGQDRSLTNTGARSDLSYVKGIHNLKVGGTYSQTFLDEHDRLGVVDPAYNPVCLNPGGSPDTNPALTNPALCGPGTPNHTLAPNPAFNPILGCYDLTRNGTLPASDGCPTGQITSGFFNFLGHTDVKELSLYAQDAITEGNWTFNVGLRGDFYNGLTSTRQAEPRAGIAYNIKRTNTVLRVSYARTLETPFNEI